MKKITLTKGFVAIVCDCCYHKVEGRKYYIHQSSTHVYARRDIWNPDKKDKKYRSTLHHDIIGKPLNGFVVDHDDGNTLNNQCNNLKIISNADNVRKQKLTKRNKSGYRGVSWHKPSEKWVVRIRVNNKSLYLGLFDDINEAAEVSKQARKKYYGVE